MVGRMIIPHHRKTEIFYKVRKLKLQRQREIYNRVFKETISEEVIEDFRKSETREPSIVFPSQ